MNGIINFNKPKGMTSHDAVYYFRRLLKIKKIGHTGTLDPDATGVLPICIGKATRVSEYLLNEDKEYIGQLTLGTETDTQDSSGEVINTSSFSVTEKDIINSFNKYKGKIDQIPPMYSAVRHKGRKLYELAREGIVVERKARQVFIYDLKILNIENNKKITFYTKCSKGTYIRTLCNDIGRDLQTYGHMSDLKRVGVGKFKIDESLSKDYLDTIDIDKIYDLILPIDMALDSLGEVRIDKIFFNKIINGVIIPIESSDLDMEKSYRVYCDSKFIGVGKIITKDNKKYIKMNKVFI